MSIKSSMIDNAFVFLSFSILITIGLFTSLKDKLGVGYFLAGRSMDWPAIGSSIFSASLFGIHSIIFFIGAAHYSEIGMIEIIAILVIILISWAIIPLYFRNKFYTFPEFLGQRYNQFSRTFIVILSLTSYLIVRIAIILFAGSVLLIGIWGNDIIASLLFIVVIAGIYSIIGGLRSIIIVDLYFSAIIILGFVALAAIRIYNASDLMVLQGNPLFDFHSIAKPILKSKLHWPEIALGAPILIFGYYCIDQFVVQKFLSGKNVKAAQMGTLLAGLLVAITIFLSLFSVPVLINSLSTPDQFKEIPFNEIVFISVLPAVFKGILLTIFLAALISSLASTFISFASLYSLDIYRRRHPSASDGALVLAGRLATAAIVCLSILSIPFIPYLTSSFIEYIILFQACTIPPIVAIFVLGVLIKKITSESATIAMIVGLFIGLVRFVGQILIDNGIIHLNFAEHLLSIHAFSFAFVLFVVSAAILLGFSFIPGILFPPVTSRKMESL